MSQQIQKCQRVKTDGCRFSILIPTWNNLGYLQLCLRSLRENSALRHQVIVMVNEGSDGTLEWVREQPGLDYVYSPTNIGICYGLNACRELVRTTYILYANDDMYFCPQWDLRLMEVAENQRDDFFMLSGTMIERAGGNPCCRIADYGDSIVNFREKELLAALPGLVRDNWSGSTWPPNLVPLALWDRVGGMSIEFSPGMYSDPDLSRKLWEAGCRTFIGVGSSLVYHFGCKSTRRIRKNKGRDTFLRKWKLTSNVFMHSYLRIGEKAIAQLPEPSLSLSQRWGLKLKLLLSILKK